jgi:hypothetical protein
LGLKYRSGDSEDVAASDEDGDIESLGYECHAGGLERFEKSWLVD